MCSWVTFSSLTSSRRGKICRQIGIESSRERSCECVCLCAQAVLSIVELGELSDGRSVRGLAAAAADAVAGSSHLSTAQLLSCCLFYWGYWLVCSCNPSFAQRAPTHGPPLSVNTSKTRKMPVSDTEAVHTIAATETEYERERLTE